MFYRVVICAPVNIVVSYSDVGQTARAGRAGFFHTGQHYRCHVVKVLEHF